MGVVISDDSGVSNPLLLTRGSTLIVLHVSCQTSCAELCHAGNYGNDLSVDASRLLYATVHFDSISGVVRLPIRGSDRF
jgi:hypothetical protein